MDLFFLRRIIFQQVHEIIMQLVFNNSWSWKFTQYDLIISYDILMVSRRTHVMYSISYNIINLFYWILKPFNNISQLPMLDKFKICYKQGVSLSFPLGRQALQYQSLHQLFRNGKFVHLKDKDSCGIKMNSKSINIIYIYIYICIYVFVASMFSIYN